MLYKFNKIDFDKLKDKIPLPKIGKIKCEKLTKINILHIAINYIRTLEDILETGELAAPIYPEKLIINPFLQHSQSMFSVGAESTDMDPRGLSPDSGIQEDSRSKEDHDEEDDEDTEDQDEFPDWTELNSTLDLRSAPPPSHTVSAPCHTVSTPSHTVSPPCHTVSPPCDTVSPQKQTAYPPISTMPGHTADLLNPSMSLSSCSL